MEKMEETLAGLAEPVLSQMRLELIDLELSRKGKQLWVRMFIDRLDQRQGGVSVDELGEFNQAMSRRLDVEELIPESYLLEISSPGLNRRLRKLKDFLKCLGQNVAVTTREDLDGKKRFRGKLTAADEAGVTVETEGIIIRIPHELIARANLEYEFK